MALRVQMSCKFPYTYSGRGGGFGRVVCTQSPSPDVEYLSIPQGEERWFIDERMTNEAQMFPSVLSALNAVRGGKTAYISLVDSPKNLGGSSLGLAAYIAARGIVTDVAVTGFVMSMGEGDIDMQIMPVDNVNRKIELAYEKQQKLIVPAACARTEKHLRDLLRAREVTTFANMEKSHGPDVFLIGCASTVPALFFVLCAMDERLKISDFMPETMNAI